MMMGKVGRGDRRLSKGRLQVGLHRTQPWFAINIRTKLLCMCLSDILRKYIVFVGTSTDGCNISGIYDDISMF